MSEVTHPNLHPLLKYFSLLSITDLVRDNEKAILFLEDLQLIPSRQSPPPFCCNEPMSSETNRSSKLGWIWRCSTKGKGSKKKGSTFCKKMESPAQGTFFDGALKKLQVKEILAIIIYFVLNFNVSETRIDLQSWRRHRYDTDDVSFGKATVINYYRTLRQVAQIIILNRGVYLGEMDDTSLSKRKHESLSMAYYRKTYLDGLYKNHKGSQLMQFLEDIRQVYPAFINGNREVPLTLLPMCRPFSCSEDSDELSPPSPKLPRIEISSE